MPRPTNPLDLVYNPRDYFPRDYWMVQWRNLVGTHHYFRVFGYMELRARHGIFKHDTVENKDICDEAKRIVQKDWGNFLPPTHENKDALERVGKTQIERVRRGHLVSFQSACLAIVALELAVRAKNSSADIYPSNCGELQRTENSIRICPALYEVSGYNSAVHQDRFPKDRRALLRATCQTISKGKPNETVFDDLSKGGLVTERLAESVVEFYHDVGPAQLCQPRYGNKYRKASGLEIQVWPL